MDEIDLSPKGLRETAGKLAVRGEGVAHAMKVLYALADQIEAIHRHSVREGERFEQQIKARAKQPNALLNDLAWKEAAPEIKQGELFERKVEPTGESALSAYLRDRTE